MELLIEENLLGGKHGNNNLRKIQPCTEIPISKCTFYGIIQKVFDWFHLTPLLYDEYANISF